MSAYSNLSRAFLALLLLFSAGQTVADSHTGGASDCSVRDSGGEVAVVICPPGSSKEAWRAAGREACSGITGICNAWVWEDGDKAPREAPATDADLPQAQVKEAVAIWVNDSERMVLLRQVAQQ